MDNNYNNILLLNLQVVLVLGFIIHQNSLRNRSYLTRSALLRPHQSPWMHLISNGNETSFLEMTGFNFEA